MKRLGTQTQLSAETGMDNGQISRLKKKHNSPIIMVGNKVDLDATIDQLTQLGYGRKKKRKNGDKEVKPAVPVSPTPQYNNDNPPPELSKNLDIATLEQIKLYEQARKLNIENNIKEGKYVDAEEVNRSAFESARKIRDMLLKIPSLMAAVVPDEFRHEAETLADKQVKEALTILADDLVSATK